MIIKKDSLRYQVRDMLADSIRTGAITCGASINEASLSKDLGISRTPLREGLLLLESEGIIVSRANKGFFVAELSAEMVREIFTVLGPLEALALRQTGKDSISLVEPLMNINQQMKQETNNSAKQFKLDCLWHDTLVSQCKNKTLIRMISTLRLLRSSQFEGAEERGTADEDNSYQDHLEITTELAKGNIEKTADGLEQHWKKGMDLVIDWVEEQNEKK